MVWSIVGSGVTQILRAVFFCCCPYSHIWLEIKKKKKKFCTALWPSLCVCVTLIFCRLLMEGARRARRSEKTNISCAVHSNHGNATNAYVERTIAQYWYIIHLCQPKLPIETNATDTRVNACCAQTLTQNTHKKKRCPGMTHTHTQIKKPKKQKWNETKPLRSARQIWCLWFANDRTACVALFLTAIQFNRYY